MVESLNAEINNCKSCQGICSYITFEKPKVFSLGNNPRVMLIGHSPTDRTSKPATTVLKMNDSKSALYKYITEDIIRPLGIKKEELYCTNLIKCFTSMPPEDINQIDKNYVETLFSKCSYLIEKEVQAIQPIVILSLSKRVCDLISEKYSNAKIDIRKGFGEIHKIKICDKEYDYIPLVHIPKNKRVKHCYFPKQTIKLIETKKVLSID